MHNDDMGKNHQFVKNFQDFDTKYFGYEHEHLNSLIKLIEHHIQAPDGFIISSSALEHFIIKNNLEDKISALLSTTHFELPESVMQIAVHIKKVINDATLPPQLENELSQNFNVLVKTAGRKELMINHSPKMFSSYESFVKKIKEIWSSLYGAKYLFTYQKNVAKKINNNGTILVQSFTDTRLKGKLYTAKLSIETQMHINKNQISKLTELGKKTQSIFYIPQEVDWIISDDKIIVTTIKPQTIV
jgi:phosphoenolpyruvate synthase/pyruvate phosphate dikinase